MSATDVSPSTTAVHAPADTRTFWRILLAIIAPMPTLTLGIEYLINPVPSDGEFATMVDAIARHRALVNVAGALGIVFDILLIPAVIALTKVAGRRAPVLTTVGALLTLPGLLAAFPLVPNDGALALLTVTNHLPVATIGKLDDGWWAQPWSATAGILFLVAIVVGLTVLAAALWRSHTVPIWMCVAIMVGGFTHPFLPTDTIQGIGLLIAAVGFTGVSRALVRMPNDEFELPPIGR
jgi:hypothetical protein